MSEINENNQFVDVICQYTKRGDMFPIRLRIQDEDGMFQTYTIKGYKQLSHPGTYTSPYGTLAHANAWRFLCRIQVLDSQKTVELFFNSTDNLWKIVRII